MAHLMQRVEEVWEEHDVDVRLEVLEVLPARLLRIISRITE